MEDRRPGIRGLDECSLSNLLRTWFKHGQLSNISIKDEEIIRSDLNEYAEDLERSIIEINSYIDGLLDRT